MSTEGLHKPSEIYDHFAVIADVSTPDKKVNILGKWLVFKHFDEIDDIWEKIRTSIGD